MRSGADFVQLDGFDPREAARLVAELRRAKPGVVVAIAGGIDERNIAEYAGTGADVIVTSAPYCAKPVDMTTVIRPRRRD